MRMALDIVAALLKQRRTGAMADRSATGPYARSATPRKEDHPLRRIGIVEFRSPQ
jgi:hypothetical protein